mmetsp:Transcript_17570/g.42740  ORF Transcript_17570/g.42740 Transcript_17570/m.42740 type:complete len:369 (-) Transcript_17570:2472-3578(-)
MTMTTATRRKHPPHCHQADGLCYLMVVVAMSVVVCLLSSSSSTQQQQPPLLMSSWRCSAFQLGTINRQSISPSTTTTTSFSKSTTTEPLRSQQKHQIGEKDPTYSTTFGLIDRRQMLARSVYAAAAATSSAASVSSSSPGIAVAAADDVTPDNEDKLVGTDPDTGKPMYKTPSGLEYIDLTSSSSTKKLPTTVSPRYGQLVGFSYVGYLLLPKDNTQGGGTGGKQKFATQSTTYITKHGNGKLIAGLDEGLHTMKVGQTRRLIIPPKLGFVQSGLGPLPEQPWQRWTLNNLLDQMISQKGGRLIYDVTLERVFDDEADQGYYEDEEITPEESAELQARLQKSQAREGRGSGSDNSDNDGAAMDGVLVN